MNSKKAHAFKMGLETTVAKDIINFVSDLRVNCLGEAIGGIHCHHLRHGEFVYRLSVSSKEQTCCASYERKVVLKVVALSVTVNEDDGEPFLAVIIYMYVDHPRDVAIQFLIRIPFLFPQCELIIN